MQNSLYAGVDEAGRGPVIGPMVMAIVLADNKTLNMYESLGVTDSKKISPSKRDELFDVINSNSDYVSYAVISALEIDTLREKISLNVIEAKSCSSLINSLPKVPEKIYIDCPDTNPPSYQNKLYSYLNTHQNLVCEHKADVNYIACSAASIIAKVVRDREIEKISDELGVSVGSGYPSDPNTKEFLRANLNNSQALKYVRKSWQTYIDFKEGGLQKTLF